MVSETIDAEQVAAYLRRHQDFLVHYPDLALGLTIPRDYGPATSLATYQLEVLRDKNRELQRRLQDLVQIAQDNETLMRRIHLLSLRLLKSRDLAEVVRQIAASLREDFLTDLVRLCLIGMPTLGFSAEWLREYPEDAAELAPLQHVLSGGRALCGRLKPATVEALFGPMAATVASAVVLPLAPCGVLGIGSTDPNRFHPGMGTDFLHLMADLMRVALAQQAERG